MQIYNDRVAAPEIVSIHLIGAGHIRCRSCRSAIIVCVILF